MLTDTLEAPAEVTDEQAVVEVSQEAIDACKQTEKLQLQHYDQIREMEISVRDLEREADEAKDEASAARKRFERADEELRNLIHDGPHRPDPQMTLPLADDAWRDVKVETLELGAAIMKSLTDANLLTIGALADYTKEYELTDIEGIGKVKADQLSDALEKFWKDSPLPAAPESVVDGEEFPRTHVKLLKKVPGHSPLSEGSTHEVVGTPVDGNLQVLGQRGKLVDLKQDDYVWVNPKS